RHLRRASLALAGQEVADHRAADLGGLRERCGGVRRSAAGMRHELRQQRAVAEAIGKGSHRTPFGSGFGTKSNLHVRSDSRYKRIGRERLTTARPTAHSVAIFATLCPFSTCWAEASRRAQG